MVKKQEPAFLLTEFLQVVLYLRHFNSWLPMLLEDTVSNVAVINEENSFLFR